MYGIVYLFIGVVIVAFVVFAFVVIVVPILAILFAVLAMFKEFFFPSS